MNPRYLDSLRARYGAHSSGTIDPMQDLVERYRQYRASSVLDLAAVASTLAINTLHDRQLDPWALKAVQDTNPNFDPHRMFGYSDDQWMGIVNTAKGKYFEYLVADKLNHGEAVGDVVLPSGYHAQLADTMNQPRWDLKIIDDHGHVADYLQLKATENLSYVHEAMTRYPDITILATDEVAAKMPHDSMVLDSHLSEHDIEKAIHTTIDGTGGGFLDNFWHSFHPAIPLLVIAVTQGYRVVIGKQHVEHATEVAKARVARAFAAGGVGAFVKALGGGWLSIPAAIFTGLMVDRVQTIDDLVKNVRSSTVKLNQRLGYYRALQLRGA
jgi:hypothetical protein